MPHYKVYGTAARSARETFAHALRRRYVERRSLVIMERAKPHIVHSTLAQSDKLRYHVDYLCGVKDTFYGCSVDHIF